MVYARGSCLLSHFDTFKSFRLLFMGVTGLLLRCKAPAVSRRSDVDFLKNELPTCKQLSGFDIHLDSFVHVVYPTDRHPVTDSHYLDGNFVVSSRIADQTCGKTSTPIFRSAGVGPTPGFSWVSALGLSAPCACGPSCRCHVP